MTLRMSYILIELNVEYTPLKKKLLAFSLQILKWLDGVQEILMSHVYPYWVFPNEKFFSLCKSELHSPKKLLPNFQKMKLNKRIFFWGV